MSIKKPKVETVNETLAQSPADIAAFAQKSVDQAQQAFEKANELAHSNVQVFDAAASAYRSRFADLQLKAMEITQINVNAGFALARKMLSLKEPTEFFSLQQDFARQQAEAVQHQVAELNELAVLLTKETVKPMQDGFSKTFGDFSKSFAA